MRAIVSKISSKIYHFVSIQNRTKLIEISSLHYFQVAIPLMRSHKVLCRRLSKSTLSPYYDHFDSLILPLFQGLFYLELISLSCFMHVIDFILKGYSIDVFTTLVLLLVSPYVRQTNIYLNLLDNLSLCIIVYSLIIYYISK